jgi:L-threonylcarbamoyladenylate synthase
VIPVPEEALAAAAEALSAGKVVVVPTDTVYGVAARAGDDDGTARLFALKGRPEAVALPVLVASSEQGEALAAEVPAPARALMAAFWPGGLTLVLRRRPGVTLHLGGRDDTTVALRVPAHPVPVLLAGRVGPLAVTSANRHGRPTPPTAAGVAAELGGVGAVLDGGRCEGSASTVVSCVDEPVVLREGAVPVEALEAVLGRLGRLV